MFRSALQLLTYTVYEIAFPCINRIEQEIGRNNLQKRKEKKATRKTQTDISFYCILTHFGSSLLS